jgi:N-acyl-D-aspartate/D-glutamate deacylase
MRSSAAVVALALALSTPATSARAQQHVDVLIRGGTVVDGSGGAPRRADVGLTGDRIAFIGDAAKARVTGTRTIDASGLVVSPGFIDPHTHTLADLNSAARKENLNYLMQGVTTVITGNDGSSPLNTAATLAHWDSAGIGTNAALLIGEGSVRGAVLGMSDAAPTSAQMDSMKALVQRGMDGGALGMSTGLYYAPGSYASTEEVIALSRVAGAAGGYYDSHLRDESSYTVGLLAAVAEALRIGREAHLPIHISHIKALGTDVWGESDSVIALVRAAQREGITVTADQYPYTASGSSVGASLLPRWAEAGGRDSLRARIDDPPTHAKLLADMANNLRRRGGPDKLLITGGRDTTLRGRTLAQVAQARGVAPLDAAIAIILNGDAGVASFNMQESDIAHFMVQDWVMTGSDGSDGHPRKYGTFPKKLREYVYTKHLITLPFFVRHSAALAAESLGMPQRGELKEGWYADVVVFDPKTVTDRSTYEHWNVLATGMRYVFVNGVTAVDGGAATGKLGGRALRRVGAGGR